MSNALGFNKWHANPSCNQVNLQVNLLRQRDSMLWLNGFSEVLATRDFIDFNFMDIYIAPN